MNARPDPHCSYIAIGDKAPEIYFRELADQCAGGRKKFGNITDSVEMRENLKINCVPEDMLDGKIPDYDVFLDRRRKLMAAKIKRYFQTL